MPACRRRAAPLRLFRRWRCGFCLRGQLGESDGVEDREVGQDLAIERHAGGFQAVNELAVGQTILARGGADALNPEFAIFAFFNATIAKGVAVRAISGFLRGLVELALCEKEAFCTLEILLSASAALCAAFYACHGFLLSFLVETNEMRSGAMKLADATGLSRLVFRIGRQPPVKRCLARWRSLRPAILRLNAGETEVEDFAEILRAASTDALRTTAGTKASRRAASACLRERRQG